MLPVPIPLGKAGRASRRAAACGYAAMCNAKLGRRVELGNLGNGKQPARRRRGPFAPPAGPRPAGAAISPPGAAHGWLGHPAPDGVIIALAAGAASETD